MNEYTVEVSVQYTARVKVKAVSAEAAEGLAYELDVAGYTQEGVEAEGHLDGGGSNPLSFMVSDSLEYPEFIRETSVVD